MYELRSLEDIEDLVFGTTVMGTGGGGDPEEGLRLLMDAINKNMTFKILSVDEIPLESIIVSPYHIGTIAPTAKSRKPVVIENPIREAFKRMERILDRKISGVIACELGGANTAVSLYIGALMDLPIIDGDLLGRAAPELHQCTVHIEGVHMYPSVIVSETGNVVIVERYADINDYESIARHLSVLSGKSVAVIDTPLNTDVLRRVAIHGSISLCKDIGKTFRRALGSRVDPVEAIVRRLDGWLVFRGVVSKYVWEDKGGFLIGEVLVNGIDEYHDKKLKTWIKNEHIFAWINDKPLIMPPDLIIFLDSFGKPITNTKLKEGLKVNVIAAKAPEIWRTPKGLELFGPRHFGFNYNYVPVENLIHGNF
jgi:DUF917 family protein